MDLSVIQTIWQVSKIAYALTDKNLLITELQGQQDVIDAEMKNCQGSALMEVFPELLGNQKDLEDILAGKLDSLKLQYVNRERMGKTVYLTMEDLPYHNQQGEIIGIIHVVQDVTSAGELEQQLTQNRNDLQLLQGQVQRQNLDLLAANAELRHLSELKSSFISVAAHELRTPLTSINGYIEMLLDGQMGALTDEEIDALTIVQESCFRLVSLTDELLNAARLEAGQIELVLQPVNLANLVRSVVSEYTGQAQSKGQDIQFEFSLELPPALCDEKRTKLIVSNLVSNAVKYTPDSGRISIRLYLSEKPGYLHLSVEDTGVGIPEEDLPKIFSRWYRGKRASSVNTEGSGLGMYITRSLVELHGGEIWVESKIGQGSVFHVRFPLAV